jgi:hypothetical protein
MGLLQNPQQSLKQATWYLDHSGEETLTGAFELAAGNLCRQTLEQVLFVLCFYSGMPPAYYLKKGRSLRTAGELFQQLKRKDITTGRDYCRSQSSVTILKTSPA